MNRSFSCFIGLSLMACVLVGPSAVRAGTITLSTGNSAISGYTGPYAQAVVTWVDSTHATVTISSLSKNGNFFYFAGTGAVAVNTNGAATVTIGSVTPAPGSIYPTGGNGTGLTAGGVGNENGFGSFSNTFNNSDGAGNAISSVTLNLTKTTGTWADADHVLSDNSNGASVAAHIFVFSGSDVSTALNPATGYASGNVGGVTVQDAPEPATMSLAGIGLVGLVGYALRRRRQKANA